MLRYLSELGRADLILLLEMAHQSIAATTVSDVRAVIERLCGQVPTEGVVVVSSTLRMMKDLTNPKMPVEHDRETKALLAHLARELRESNSGAGATAGIVAMNVGHPDEWLEAYARNNYFACDPRKEVLAAGAEFLRWSDSFSKVELGIQKLYVRHARDFGMGEGVTVASRQNSSGLMTSLAFWSKESAVRTRDQVILRYMAHYLHAAIVRTAASTFGAEPLAARAVLSRRETEVLYWAKDGKTNWEISMILRISERTAKFHVQNAMRKLDASSRAQAVAIALHQGLIRS